jgi:ankyrin repeat protein
MSRCYIFARRNEEIQYEGPESEDYNIYSHRSFPSNLFIFVLIWTGVAYALPADDLYLAAGTGNIKEVRKLLNQGVNPNAAVDTSGITALMQAARTGGDTDIVKLLLNKGANINARAGQMGITALMNAAAFGDVEMVRLLIDKGADINAKDTEGLTALSQAKVAKKEDIVDLLKTHGANEKSEGQSSFNCTTQDFI